MFADQTGIAAIDPRVLDAMREVPRHAFVPEVLRPYAYLPRPLPVTPEQNMAAPLLIALMTHVVARAAGRHRVRDRHRRRLPRRGALAAGARTSTASR